MGNRQDIDLEKFHKLMGKGKLYFQEMDFRESSSLFARAAAENPVSMEAWYLLGLSLCETGHFVEAEDALSKANKLDEKFPDAWLFRAVALCRSGRQKEAVEFYEKAMILDKENVSAFQNYRELCILFQEEIPDEIMDNFIPLVKKNTEDWAAFRMMDVFKTAMNGGDYINEMQKWFKEFKGVKLVWNFCDIQEAVEFKRVPQDKIGALLELVITFKKLTK